MKYIFRNKAVPWLLATHFSIYVVQIKICNEEISKKHVLHFIIIIFVNYHEISLKLLNAEVTEWSIRPVQSSSRMERIMCLSWVRVQGVLYWVINRNILSFSFFKDFV